jgi:putative NIF3 family GTP cyclohydrolase 1 type 2
MGMYGNIENSYNENDFINYVKKQMDLKYMRHSKFLNKKIKKVAVLGGSGSFGINDAIEKNIDCFITSDLKYHDFFKAENKLLLIDIGHYESEQHIKNILVAYLKKKITNFAVVLSTINTNPVKYT